MDATLQAALAKYNQGPVQVVFDPSGDNLELFVDGGCEPNFTRGQEQVEMDVVGIYDIRTTGDGGTLELNLPEDSLDVVQALFPEGADGSGSSPAYQGFGRAAGLSMRTYAVQVRLRPWQTRTLDTEQIVFWKMVPEGDAQKTMTKAGKHAWRQTFRALPDVTKGDGNLIARINTTARS